MFSDADLIMLASEEGLLGVSKIANTRHRKEYPLLGNPIKEWMVREVLCAQIELVNEKKKGVKVGIKKNNNPI